MAVTQTFSEGSFDVAQSVTTTQVLGDIVDMQLREAAWCTMARLRQLAQPQGSLLALRRWERNLCGNMAGLASVMNTRLSVRLQNLLTSPQDLVSEAFVAGLLLLRCDRDRFETVVVQAWREAQSHELQEYLALALIHGGIANTEHTALVIDALCSQNPTLRASAGRIIGARQIAVSQAAADALRLQSRSCAQAQRLLLNLMADGCMPLDEHLAAKALHAHDTDLTHAVEQALMRCSPQSLAERARRVLQRGENASLLSLEALCGTMLSAHRNAQHDLSLLDVTASRGRMGPLIAHALGLTGTDDGARLLLRLLHRSTTAAMQHSAQEGFTAITGIEAPMIEEGDVQKRGVAMAQELSQAWRPSQKSTAIHQHTKWFGRTPTLADVLQALPQLQVGRWQSFRRLLCARTLGACSLSPWALVQQQLAQLQSHDTRVSYAFSPSAKGLQKDATLLRLVSRGAL